MLVATILGLAPPVVASAQGLSGYAVGGVGGGPDEGSLLYGGGGGEFVTRIGLGVQRSSSAVHPSTSHA